MRNKNFYLVMLMHEKGLNQADLTQVAKISSESRLSRIINGRVIPREDELKRICDALACKLEELTNGRD